MSHAVPFTPGSRCGAQGAGVWVPRPLCTCPSCGELQLRPPPFVMPQECIHVAGQGHISSLSLLSLGFSLTSSVYWHKVN